MSWTDKNAIKCIKYLRDKYKINTFVETGTFVGVNARLHSKTFKYVLTCEKIDKYFQQAVKNLQYYENVYVGNENSPDFLKSLYDKKYIFFLDAHFYSKNMPKGKGKFIILKELDNMKRFKDSIIIIHDFDCGLGHCCYDGVRLDMDLLRSRLKKINKNFHYYTNRLESCDIVKPTFDDIKSAGLEVDEDTLENLQYAWSSPRLTYRGILYCLPTKLNDKELNNLGLRKWN